MKRALALASRGAGRTSPNPAVGAVVVKNGHIVGEGWHQRAGGPHAEVLALAAAGNRARGSTLYVTLEPCSHVGKTPPCTLAVIQAGVGMVVYAVGDPNPVAAGGSERLRKAGIQVIAGVLEAQGRELLLPFLAALEKHRPFVELKMAMTLDGKTADRFGNSRYLTSPPSLKQVHRMRNRADAVLVGANTLLQDNPLLTCRHVPNGRDPVRVVLDPRLAAARPELKIFHEGTSGVWICVFPDTPREDKNWPGHVRFLEVDPDVRGRMPSASILRALFDRDVRHVLLEGGATTAAAFLEDGVVDRLHFVYSPRLMLDGAAMGAVHGPSHHALDELMAVKNLRVTRRGPDLWVQGDL